MLESYLQLPEHYLYGLIKEAKVSKGIKGIQKFKKLRRAKIRNLTASSPSTSRVPLTAKATATINVPKVLDNPPVTLPDSARLKLDLALKDKSISGTEQVKKAKKIIQQSIPEGDVLRDLKYHSDLSFNKINNVLNSGTSRLRDMLTPISKDRAATLGMIGGGSIVTALGLRTIMDKLSDRYLAIQQELAGSPIRSKSKPTSTTATESTPKQETPTKDTKDTKPSDKSYTGMVTGGIGGGLLGAWSAYKLSKNKPKTTRALLTALGLAAGAGAGGYLGSRFDS